MNRSGVGWLVGWCVWHTTAYLNLCRLCWIIITIIIIIMPKKSRVNFFCFFLLSIFCFCYCFVLFFHIRHPPPTTPTRLLCTSTYLCFPAFRFISFFLYFCVEVSMYENVSWFSTLSCVFYFHISFSHFVEWMAVNS